MEAKNDERTHLRPPPASHFFFLVQKIIPTQKARWKKKRNEKLFLHHTKLEKITGKSFSISPNELWWCIGLRGWEQSCRNGGWAGVRVERRGRSKRGKKFWCCKLSEPSGRTGERKNGRVEGFKHLSELIFVILSWTHLRQLKLYKNIQLNSRLRVG